MHLVLLAASALTAVSAAVPGGCLINQNDRAHVPEWSRCDQLYAQLKSGNSVAGWRNWCVGEGNDRCCVSWSKDCTDRTWDDVLTIANSMDYCRHQDGLSGYTSGADDCLGDVCIAKTDYCPSG